MPNIKDSEGLSDQDQTALGWGWLASLGILCTLIGSGIALETCYKYNISFPELLVIIYKSLSN